MKPRPAANQTTSCARFTGPTIALADDARKIGAGSIAKIDPEKTPRLATPSPIGVVRIDVNLLGQYRVSGAVGSHGERLLPSFFDDHERAWLN